MVSRVKKQSPLDATLFWCQQSGILHSQESSDTKPHPENMIGMSTHAIMESHETNAPPVPQPQSTGLAQGEPQLQNEVQELREQVNNDQKQLESIHNELKRLSERDITKTEMQEEMDHVIDVIHATHSKSQESTVGNLQQLSSTMEEFSCMMRNQQDQLIMGINSAIQGMSKAITDTLINHSNNPTKNPSVSVDSNQANVHTSQTSATHLNPQKTKRTTHHLHNPSSSEESDDEIAEPEELIQVTQSVRSHELRERGQRSNIPPFSGRETWKVWFTRFKDIAQRQGWDDDEKLDVLLPRLQGEAGSFVYDQLSSRVRNNYELLTRELKNRFRQVENPKTFSAMFAARRQKATETVESFAAELKKIYDKAYAKRDPRTREEDLLRKFLDGLQDTKAACHVEFVKDPKNIDVAVDEVINFQEVHKKQNRTMRRIGHDQISSDEESEYTIARTSGRPPKSHTLKASDETSVTILEAKMEEMAKQLRELCNNQRQFPNMSNVFRQGRPRQGNYTNNSFYTNLRCYNCNEVGHVQRNCPQSRKAPIISTTPKGPGETPKQGNGQGNDPENQVGPRQ